MDFELIKKLHYSDKLDCVSIAKIFGVSKKRIHTIFKSNGCKVINHRVKVFDKSNIIKLHHDDKLTIQQMSKLHGCSSHSIKSFMVKNNIEHIKFNAVSINEADLIELHINKRKSLTEISKILGCSIDAVKSNLDKFSIDTIDHRLKSKHIRPESVVKYHHIDKMSLSDISKLYGCDKMVISRICKKNNIDILSHQITSNHRKVKGLLDSLGIEYLDNCRDIIKPLELDIYIPEHKIAIEFNGVYWHSENFVDKNYHYNKWKSCKDIGIELIQIWEDDFNINEPKILKFIKYKLGFNAGKVFARKSTIISLGKDVASQFHDTYHIQGKCPTSFNIGLEANGHLVAVCSFKRTGNTLDLVRYSTSINVVGGFTKILSYVIKNIDFKEIITFADLCHSNGNLYNISGFVVDKILPPDYKYVVGNIRKHKFGYRKKAFKNNPNLLYEPNLTERELAKLNGLCRVYDAGKIRYKLVK